MAQLKASSTGDRVMFDREPRTSALLLPVDLDIDSNNDGEITEADEAVEDVESGEGSITKMGKHINVNSFDFDADDVPDYADGFGKVATDGGEITGRTFVPIELLLPDLRSTTFQVKFQYSASDPDGVTTSTNPEGEIEVTLPDTNKLRIWTKDANETRDPQTFSAQGGGDFIPDDEFIDSADLFAGETTGTLYVEGISHSANWGEDKITIEYYIDDQGTQEKIGEEAVTVTITESQFRLHVYRPYTFNETTGERPAFIADYTTPRTAFGSLMEALQEPDSSLRGGGNWYGHGFWRVTYSGPDATSIVPETNESGSSDRIRWSGKTGGKDGIFFPNLDNYHSFRDGVVFWHSDPGTDHGNGNPFRSNFDTFTAAGNVITNFDQQAVSIMAYHDFALHPALLKKASDYADNVHDFSTFGLDIDDTKGGCASYTSLTMKHMGLTEYELFEVKRHLQEEYGEVNEFPVVSFASALPSIPVSDPLPDSYYATAKSIYIADPSTTAWGSGAARVVNYFDPALLAIWIDEMLAEDRQATIYNLSGPEGEENE